MDDMYREEILSHYKRPRNWGPLEDPDLEFEDTNPLCGDELKVMLKVDGDRVVTDVRFDGHGCAISQASASMASEELVGKPSTSSSRSTSRSSSTCSASTSPRRG
jgi:nitrogen fixation NifU-like protein